MSAAASPAPLRPERVLTLPLRLFLAVVALVVAGSWWSRQAQAPADLAAVVRELADGDADGDERRALLARVQRLASARDDAYGAWAARLAAIALDDASGFGKAVGGAGSPPAPAAPMPAELAPWQSLGDALVGNAATALRREQQGDRPGARAAWAQVEAQARLTGHALGAELAAAARQRLR